MLKSGDQVRPGGRNILRLCAALFLVTGLLCAQPLNVRISSLNIQRPNEPTIAVNPVDPLQIAAGSNLLYFYRSADGGFTWSESALPYGTWGDPCVLFDGLGNLYFAHLANLDTGYFIDRLIVRRSTDGGQTWAGATDVGYSPPRRQQDKEWLATDLTSSPFSGRLYMAWTEFDEYGSTLAQDSSRILFSRSSDQGVGWSTPGRISDQAGDCIDGDNTVEGAVPAVGPNGEVYVSWAGPLGIMCDKSTDGGVTFGADRFVSSQPGGWAIDVPGIYRCNGMPVTACDVSSSLYRGTVYVTWTDQRNGLDNTDVFLAKSTDGGETWSSPRRVNDDFTVSHQFFVWMAVDQSTGALYCVYYDRNGRLGDTTDVTLARSTDGGESFRTSRISASPFVPVKQVFFGDYTNIAAANGKIYPIWGRTERDGQQSIWVALVSDTATVDIQALVEVPTGRALLQNYPNPFNPSTVIEYTIPAGNESERVVLTVHDLLGREVARLVDAVEGPGWYSVTFRPSGIGTGVYLYRLVSGGKREQKTMIYLK